MSEGHKHITVPNFVKIGRSVVEILRFFGLLRWPPPPSWIFEIVIFYWLLGWRGSRRMSVPNFVKIRSIGCEDMKIFPFFKMAAAAILDFRNREILLDMWSQTVESHQYVKFCQNRSISSEDIKIFRFFKMAAVRHLGFVWGIFGPPTVSIWGSLSLCKIWL